MINNMAGINWPLLRARVRLRIMAARCRAAGVIRTELEGGA